MNTMLTEWANTTIGFSMLAFAVIIAFCLMNLGAIKVIEFFAFRANPSPQTSLVNHKVLRHRFF